LSILSSSRRVYIIFIPTGYPAAVLIRNTEKSSQGSLKIYSDTILNGRLRTASIPDFIITDDIIINPYIDGIITVRHIFIDFITASLIDSEKYMYAIAIKTDTAENIVFFTLFIQSPLLKIYADKEL